MSEVLNEADQGVMLRELVKELAECLIQFDSLRDLQRALEEAHIFSSLSYDEEGDEEEELDRLADQLFDLVKGYSLLPRDQESLRLVQELEPDQRGEWACEEVMSRLSN